MKTEKERITEIKKYFDLAVISKYVTAEAIEEYKKRSGKSYHDRIYGLQVTVNGMLYQALNEDKSEQNAVLYIAEQYRRLREEEAKKMEAAKQAETEARTEKKKIGRPRKHFTEVARSKMKPISLNTASYDEARQRTPEGLLKELMERLNREHTALRLWKGHRVFIVDGTTFKTTDNPELRQYFMPKKDTNPQPVPIGRMEGVIDMFGGIVVDFVVGTYNSSEGKMLRELLAKIEKGTILIGDDLYSAYGYFAYCQVNGLELLARGKHDRQEKVIEKLAENDVLVMWKSQQEPAWFLEEDQLPKTIVLRRIIIKDQKNPGKEITVYTTLTDRDQYPASEIIDLAKNRWDIEIGFREIKDILGMEHMRGKTVSMVKKEIYCYLILYNVIRIIMTDTLEKNDRDFFFHGEKVQSISPASKNKSAYVDKLGRSYARRSPGRYGGVHNK